MDRTPCTSVHRIPGAEGPPKDGRLPGHAPHTTADPDYPIRMRIRSLVVRMRACAKQRRSPVAPGGGPEHNRRLSLMRSNIPRHPRDAARWRTDEVHRCMTRRMEPEAVARRPCRQWRAFGCVHASPAPPPSRTLYQGMRRPSSPATWRGVCGRARITRGRTGLHVRERRACVPGRKQCGATRVF